MSYCVKGSWEPGENPQAQEPQEEHHRSTQKDIRTNFMVLRSELSRTGVKLLCLI